MSVFDESGRPVNYLETLVGEGKKFQTPEDLAKGKWESDQYIESMKTELETARTELEARKRVEELLKEQRQNSNANGNTSVETHQPAAETQPKPFTQEDFDKRVREIAAERDVELRTANNVNSVSAKLVEIYGSEENAQKAVATRARELEVPVSVLQSIAAQSPKAFFAQLGVATAATTNGPTHGNVNAAAFSSGQVKAEDKYSYFQEVRKTNPALYKSVEFQTRMHETAARVGESFFDT